MDDYKLQVVTIAQLKQISKGKEILGAVYCGANADPINVKLVKADLFYALDEANVRTVLINEQRLLSNTVFFQEVLTYN